MPWCLVPGASLTVIFEFMLEVNFLCETALNNQFFLAKLLPSMLLLSVWTLDTMEADARISLYLPDLIDIWSRVSVAFSLS